VTTFRSTLGCGPEGPQPRQQRSQGAGAATIDGVDDNWEGKVQSVAWLPGEVVGRGAAGMGELAISVGAARGAVACAGLAGMGA